jgi:hypothetical protein
MFRTRALHCRDVHFVTFGSARLVQLMSAAAAAAADQKAAPLVGMELLQASRGGFNFDLCKRNDFLAKMGKAMPNPKKTGTTICGMVYNDGVVLGADTRATGGSIVCDKNCAKIHHITKNIWCCGAGTSADTEAVTGLISSQLELHRLATNSEPRVITAMTRLKHHLFKYAAASHVAARLLHTLRFWCFFRAGTRDT